MRTQSRQLIRYGLAVLTTVVAVGCKSDGDDITDPGAIALALNPTSASVAQGGNTAVNATLTRSGGFTGSVTLNVTGSPAGVTSPCRISRRCPGGSTPGPRPPATR